MAETKENLTSVNVRSVKELILDEKKLVTYVSLSKDLCIHVNEAKTLLMQVVDDIKRNNSNSKLNVNYIISGLSSNNSGRVTMCTESDLEIQKNTFKAVFFQHIYSVSQGSSGLDNAAFVTLNKFEDLSLCAGLIKGGSCIKRSSDEIGTLKSNSQKIINEQKALVPPKKETKDTKGVQNGHKDNIVKVHETKSEPVIKSEIISPKKDTSSNSNGKSSANNGSKPKGIAGFFTKSNSAPIAKSTKATKEAVKATLIKKETEPEVKKECQQEIKKVECMEIDEEVSEIKIKKEPESTKKSKSKKNSSLHIKNAKVDKKRKRVLRVSDSESDEENDPFADEKPANHESDDEIPPTPSINTVKVTSGLLNPKKRRKIVDKTYTDEEGYILTRKEEVYESCSEEEVETVNAEPIPVKVEKENVEQANKVKIEVSPKGKKGKSNTKKKVSPPQKGKQSTLTNFFKKV